ncbi:putative membrane protein DUF2207 [Microterricola gilva]|uniref:Putative membrane protein DUF2207 n=1 Tax=Microterricola gilva TaxID=393267 RepID=A0A4Q8AL57_9MICO|nr:DUF2207 domain-containing protein [Microterricola gilva]RZU64673.1 putative membrane protein DUF2207 [Microterricola gilva]
MRRLVIQLGSAMIMTALFLATAVGPALITQPATASDEHAVAALGPKLGVDDFRFASLDAEYLLGRDSDGRSTLAVTETLVAVFPEIDQNRGIRRAIPLRYDGHPTDVRVLSVTDENGVARGFEQENDEDDEFLLVTIAADGYVHGAQSYVIRYTQNNVTLDPDDSDVQEFYWDVNGTGWAQPFDRVNAVVTMDDALGDAFTGDVACYRGPEGSTTRCEQLVVGESLPPVIMVGAADLGAFENLSVAMAFDPGTFVPRDASLAASTPGLIGLGAGIVSVAGLIAAIVARRTRWRSAAGRGLVIAEYESPPGVDPLLAAELLGAETKGVTATILDLAVNGAVRIIETKKKRFELELHDPALVTAEGAPVLAALFGDNAAPGARRKLGSSDSALASALVSVGRSTRARSTAAGFRRPVGVGGRIALAAVVLITAVVAVIGSIIALDTDRGGVWPVFVMLASIVAAVFVLILLIDVRPLTRQGAIAKEQLRGLELFIRLAEADRLRMLQSPSGALRDPVASGVATAGVALADAGSPGPVSPDQVLRLHEKLLPYSVLFGQEKEWSAELASLYERAGTDPSWYSGRSGFNVAAFSAGVGSFATASSTSWSSSGSSSSSGGSGGGGSSGGGGGGGGGGGV